MMSDTLFSYSHDEAHYYTNNGLSTYFTCHINHLSFVQWSELKYEVNRISLYMLNNAFSDLKRAYIMGISN